MAALLAAASMIVTAGAVAAEPATSIWVGFGPGGPSQKPPANPPSWWGKRSDGPQMFIEQNEWPVTFAHTTTVLTSGQAIAAACLETKSSPTSKTCADLGVGNDHSLEQYFRNIKTHHKTFALEIGLLVDTQADGDKINRGCGSEAWGTEGDLRGALQKIKQAGGDLDLLRMDEPFYFGVIGCHETPEHVAQHLQRTIGGIVRSYFPDVKIGDIEPVTGGADQPRKMAQWADAYRSTVGITLAFFHADANWRAGRPASNFPAIARAMHERGIPFGVIYDGEDDSSSEAWTKTAIDHFVQTESIEGLHVDHAIFQSWTAEPDTMLPETKVGTLTNVGYQYLLPPSLLSASTAGGKVLRLHLAGADQRPIIGARIDGEVVGAADPRDLEKRHLSGNAPANAAYAVIGLRANAEGATAATNGEVDLGPIEFRYQSPAGAPAVWRSSFPTPRRIAISPTSKLVSNLAGGVAACGLSVVPIAPNSRYAADVAMSATSSADRAGYVTIIFLDEKCHGISRRFVMFTPSKQPLAIPLTDASGDASVPLNASFVGNEKRLELLYVGDNLKHRPAGATVKMGP